MMHDWMLLGRRDGPLGTRALGKDVTLRLGRSHGGLLVSVTGGTVLVTREGDAHDYVLERGDELRLPPDGLAVAWALEASTVVIAKAREDRARTAPCPVTPARAAP